MRFSFSKQVGQFCGRFGLQQEFSVLLLVRTRCEIMTTEYMLFDFKITQIHVNRNEETSSAANMQVENRVTLDDEFVKI